MKPRLGCVPYLNAKPLIAWFSMGEEAGADVVFDDPSLLGPMVKEGTLDAAIASSFFAIADPSLKIAADVSISSNGPVRSVRLLSRKPVEEIESLALDQASMTSNHLARIWLAEAHGRSPKVQARPADLESMLAEFDAAVLIGDAGMSANAEGLHVVDLGEAWHDWTGLPFVWAVWVGKNGLTPQLAEQLRSAKDYGVRNVDEIASGAAHELGWDFEKCRDYLHHAIDFDLGDRHLQGLALFAEKCRQHGFVRRDWSPEIVRPPVPSSL